MNQYRRAGIFICAILVIFLGVTACGKKGPPVVPGTEDRIVSAPGDVGYEIVDDTAVLSWKFDLSSLDSTEKLAGFDIFAATRDIEGCPGCPLLFEKIGTAPGSARSFSMRIKKERRNYFKLQAVLESGFKGEFSKTVQVDMF